MKIKKKATKEKGCFCKTCGEKIIDDDYEIWESWDYDKSHLIFCSAECCAQWFGDRVYYHDLVRDGVIEDDGDDE